MIYELTLDLELEVPTVADPEQFVLAQADCLQVLKLMKDSSIDSIVTDPPYGLSFMGKKWDYDVPDEAIWRECLRVLKPGGHILSFAGTRTQHRMAVRIEDAGFEIRDMIAWVYGSGFPKSHNGEWGGTALKPALEPITVARKPLEGTVEANWSEHGTGALNIDGCRVAGEVPRTVQGQSARSGEVYGEDQRDQRVFEPHEAGRWPANLIHDGSEEVLAAFPQAPGQVAAIKGTEPSVPAKGDVAYGFRERVGIAPRADAGSAARFFYCAKASKKDRDEGLEDAEDRVLARSCQAQADAKRGIVVSEEGGAFNKARVRKNNHPTVKPTDLMRYLCRLVTPPGGVVLDPFMGSGSTGKACMLEGFRFVGIEREAEYLEIAKERITTAQPRDPNP